MGLAVLGPVESFRTRDQTHSHVPCIGRHIFIHYTPREVPNQLFKRLLLQSIFFYLAFIFYYLVFISFSIYFY